LKENKNSIQGESLMPKIKRALISVWDKTGIVDFARSLTDLGVEILSTGGTARLLKDAKIPVKEVSQYTGAPEILKGRVKTLHPKIHGGLLALRDDSDQMEEVRRQGIELIDMVVVNLYPFVDVIKNKEVSLEDALENIDIGGPTMLRSGAKNFKNVAVVSSPKQYNLVLEELKRNNGCLSERTCYKLAIEVFQLTSSYDSVIANYFAQKEGVRFPSTLTFAFKKVMDLRYGENPHQKAAFYQDWNPPEGTLPLAEKLWGKEVSFNNLLDFQAALKIAGNMDNPFVVVIKHNNPCGAAEGDSLEDACVKAFQGDPVSAFGSIVGLNRKVDAQTADFIASPYRFIEGIIAPDYTQDALKILKEKRPWGKRVIILKIDFSSDEKIGEDMRRIRGGLLIQDEDTRLYQDDVPRVVTARHPSKTEKNDLEFAWKICRYVKSNAILIAKEKAVVGVGAGQMSRIDAALIAIRKAGKRTEGAVLASDAFFPFPDVVEEAGRSGITAIIQPGGALRDNEVIKMANRYNIAMVFTGIRHFLH